MHACLHLCVGLFDFQGGNLPQADMAAWLLFRSVKRCPAFTLSSVGFPLSDKARRIQELDLEVLRHCVDTVFLYLPGRFSKTK